jgi:hypothetical protein
MGSEEKVQVVKISEEKVFGDFRKKELIAKTLGQYPMDVVFEFPNDKMDLIGMVNEGDIITISFNIRSRKVEKEGKDDMYFTSLSGWKVVAE